MTGCSQYICIIIQVFKSSTGSHLGQFATKEVLKHVIFKGVLVAPNISSYTGTKSTFASCFVTKKGG